MFDYDFLNSEVKLELKSNISAEFSNIHRIKFYFSFDLFSWKSVPLFSSVKKMHYCTYRISIEF